MIGFPFDATNVMNGATLGETVQDFGILIRQGGPIDLDLGLEISVVNRIDHQFRIPVGKNQIMEFVRAFRATILTMDKKDNFFAHPMRMMLELEEIRITGDSLATLDPQLLLTVLSIHLVPGMLHPDRTHHFEGIRKTINEWTNDGFASLWFSQKSHPIPTDGQFNF